MEINMTLIDLDDDRHFYIHDDGDNENYGVWVIKRDAIVDAIPIEWINQRVKGLKIQLINADEDDVDLIWHLRDEIQTLTELIDYWKEEQEKQQ